MISTSLFVIVYLGDNMAARKNKPDKKQSSPGLTAEKQLKIRNEWFDAIFHGARDAIFISNEHADFVNHNKAAETLTGYSSDELSSMSITDLYAPEDLDAFTQYFATIMAGKEVTSTADILKKDGTKVAVEFSNRSLMIDGEKYIHTIARDISERLSAQEKILRSEKDYRELFEDSPIGIFKTNSKGTPLMINPEMARIVGAESVSDALSRVKNISETLYVDPQRRTLFLQILKEKGSVHNYAYNAKRLDGKNIVISTTAKISESLADGSFIIEGFATDITDRKEAEEALSETYKKYYSFLNNTSEGIFLQMMKEPIPTSLPVEKQVDALYKNAFIAECNDSLARMYGLSKCQDLLGKKLIDLHGGKDHPVNRAEMKRFIKNGYRENSELSHEICPDGTDRYFLNTTTGVIEDGNLIYLWGTQTDITENRRAEDKIIRLSEAISQLKEIVVITNTEGDILYANPAFEDITGFASEEALGQKPSILKSGLHDNGFYEDLWNTISKGERWSGNITNKRSDGSFFTSSSSISPVKNNEGKVTNFVWIARDITEELSLKNSIEQARKMEAVGTLAGGIAHDFNNILTSVLGFTELALNDVKKGTLQEERLQAVHSAGKRARDLVKQILTFARKSDEESKPLQVDVIIKETLKLLRSTIPSTIKLDQDINSDSKIKGVPTQVHQIIMNLCANASQAMEEDGGILKVSLRDIRLNSSFTKKYVGLKPGNYLELKVSDTGKGISPKIIGSIFEPYFTTKEKGEGTGMGLATVHGIIKEYNGEILVESELDKGTVFTVYLPVCKKKVKPKRPKAGRPSSGTENILVVDDEPQVAKITGLSLSRLGYNVTTRTDSLKALEIFQDAPDAFDLVITDMTMPGMTGDKLTRKLLDIKPDIPVILCTGYAKKFAGKETNIKGIRAFAYKPVSSADLAEIVRKVLDGHKKK